MVESALTLEHVMGYDVCHIMCIEKPVDVDTTPTTHGGLLQTFALLDPCISGTCVVIRMCAVCINSRYRSLS